MRALTLAIQALYVVLFLSLGGLAYLYVTYLYAGAPTYHEPGGRGSFAGLNR
jgi:hypothetical protein